MEFLTPGNLPVIFIGVALIYLVNWLRHRGAGNNGNGNVIAQRNRVRMVVIFGVIGGGQLVWRLIGQG